MGTISLTKHHGLGNDFLVLLDLDARHPLEARLARALCDRHHGVGADGLIRVTPGRDGADVTMEVRNADGSEAEIRGNGIRCLAQAVVDAEVVTGPEVRVRTASGVRRLVVEGGEGPGAVMVTAEMGPAKVGPDEPQTAPGQRVRTVDMGNPHLVILGGDPWELDVTRLGSHLQVGHPGGVNVEFAMTGPGEDALSMRVWERGVGETLACGSGACAAAAAAHEWGLVGAHVVVHQPGGAVEVDVRPETVVLKGPARRIARVEVDMA